MSGQDRPTPVPAPASRFLWFDTTNRMRIEAGRRRIPLIGTFELTARCNLGCRMCYIRRDAGDRDVARQEVSGAAWIRMAEEARAEGLLFLLLTGGEPMLRTDFWDVYEALCGMGFIVNLFTNATMIDAAAAARFARRPPGKAVVTIYGASAETYGAVCRNPVAFDRAVAGTKRLVDAGIHTEVRATVCKDNVRDLEAIDVLGQRLTGRTMVETNMMLTPPVRGACTCAAERRLEPHEIMALGKKDQPGCEDETVAADPNEEVHVSHVPGAIPRSQLDAPNYDALPPMYCSGGRSSFWAAWDGRMLPCALMDYPATDPVGDGFAAAWRKLVEETDRIPGATPCRGCPYRRYCSVCPGRLQAETGSFTEAAPYVCAVARELHAKETAAPA